MKREGGSERGRKGRREGGMKEVREGGTKEVREGKLTEKRRKGGEGKRYERRYKKSLSRVTRRKNLFKNIEIEWRMDS